MKMRDRRRQRPAARAAPVAYYVSIPRRAGRSQFLAAVSTHITINGVRLPLDRPRTVLADTKNGSPRIVPALPIITSACRVPPPRRSEIDYYWPLAREACGLGHVRLHDLRHTAASEMVTAGADLGAVGAVLGHKSAATTKRYAHYGVQRLADTLRRRG